MAVLPCRRAYINTCKSSIDTYCSYTTNNNNLTTYKNKNKATTLYKTNNYIANALQQLRNNATEETMQFILVKLTDESSS